MISVVMPVFNRENYLRQAIESILKQTYQDFELIVVDNGSTDNCLTIAQEYSYIDSRVKIIVQNQQGYSKALGLGYSLADDKSAYLCTVDSDDFISINCFESAKTFLDKYSNTSYIYSQYYDVDELGNNPVLGSRCRINYDYKLLLFKFMTFHFRLIRKEAYQKVGGINQSLNCASDYDLCLKLSEVGEVKQLKEPLYYYRNHSSQMSVLYEVKQARDSMFAARQAMHRRALA